MRHSHEKHCCDTIKCISVPSSCLCYIFTHFASLCHYTLLVHLRAFDKRSQNLKNVQYHHGHTACPGHYRQSLLIRCVYIAERMLLNNKFTCHRYPSFWLIKLIDSVFVVAFTLPFHTIVPFVTVTTRTFRTTGNVVFLFDFLYFNYSKHT